MDWHTKSPQEVFEILNSSEKGLSSDEARKRLLKYGLNKLPEGKSESLFLICLKQFQSPLILILFIATIVVLSMGEYLDGGIILFTLIFNAVVGTIQEGKANNTLSALKKYSETTTLIRRDAREIVIPDGEIIPGDIIILHEGDKIPTDGRVIISNSLQVDESSLTGESAPIFKTSEALMTLKLPTEDQKNMVFKGTHIVLGNAVVVVTATGTETVIGKISKEISKIDSELPLKNNIRYLTRLIIMVVASITAIIFVLGILEGKPMREMFAVAVSLAVSIIPEGLPIVMTLVLATGVWRMSKKNALVKKLQAVEALGQAEIIAVDKTGTLTKNEIVLQKVYVNGKSFEIESKNFKELIFSARIAAFCGGSSDPTDIALSGFAKKLGFDIYDLEKDLPKLSEIPFEYKNKFHAVSHLVEGKILATITGAPEEILKLSEKMMENGREKNLTEEGRSKLEQILNEMSSEGLRIIAFAMKENAPEILKTKDIASLTFVGFFGLKDIIRPEVKESIDEAKRAGIKVVIITGDHLITAKSIAEEVGIYHEGDKILTGEDLETLSQDELLKVLDTVSVFARVTPEHKLKIIELYKSKGLTVSMTGDGVNDAPSLVAADLGISMGKIGTEVAKEASDIVLLDDNFKSIVYAVEEGRNIYKTIKKVILYLFSTGFGEVFTIFGALLLGFPLPLLAAQIVWLNLVTDGFLDVSLAMEPKEEGLLKGKFIKPSKYLLDKTSIIRMFMMAGVMMTGTLILFSQYYQFDLIKAQTMALTLLAVFQWFNAYNCRNETKSIFSMNPFSNKYLIGAIIIVITLQMMAIYNPLMQKILHTTPLSLSEWLIIIPIAFSVIVVEEIRKLIMRGLRKSFNE
jgi:Ca2+-transporting ATPase